MSTLNQKLTSEERETLRLRLLVMRCQVGDVDAFESLYKMFGERTLRYLKGMLIDSDAHDAHQDVWLNVYRRVSALSNPGGFRTWLYRIVRNRAVDTLRRRNRQEGLVDRIDGDSASALPDSADDNSRNDNVEELSRAMVTLATIHREVLMLAFWEDMRYEEIALVVGVPVGTIRSRLHHAKSKLRSAIEALREPST